ncbi:MAG: universal stress protein UspA [Rhodobacteraceae bacterium]|nr:universal stress protein UspA [Paracoccaceae bacterium]
MFAKILLAVDLNETEGSAKAAKAALGLAAQSAGTIDVVNVVPDTGMAIVGAAIGPDLEGQVLDEARDTLRSFAKTHLPGLAETACHIVQGTIYDRIIATANALEADTIVVGAHRPEFRDYLVGPNAARVVRHASQSVLVVR